MEIVGIGWEAESGGMICRPEWAPVIAGHVYKSARAQRIAIYVLKKIILVERESGGLRVESAVSECIRRSLDCNISVCSSSDTLEYHGTHRLLGFSTCMTMRPSRIVALARVWRDEEHLGF